MVTARGSTSDAGDTPAIDAVRSEQLRRLTAACSSLAAGFAVSAKHTSDATIASKALTLAEVHRVLEREIATALAPLGFVPRRASTSERLRWEWLASTAAVLDGAPDARMLAECARLEREAIDAAAALVSPLDHVARALRGAWAALERLLETPPTLASI